MLFRISFVVFFFISNICANASTPAFKFQFKGALEQYNSNDKTDTTADANDENRSRRFRWSYARIGMTGKIDENLSYKVKMRLNGNMTGINGNGTNPDNMGSWVDYAYIDNKISDKVKLRIGKQKVKHGAWEGTYSGMDLYGAISAVRQNSGEGGYIDGYFASGLGLHYINDYGLIEIQIADPDNHQPDQPNSQGFLTGIRWEGSFRNNTLNPILTYHQFEKTKQVDSSGSTTEKATVDATSGVGIQYKVNGLKAELDFIQFVAPSNDPTGAQKENKTESYSLRISKWSGDLHPILKMVSNNYDGDDSSTATKSFASTAYSLVLEYYPYYEHRYKLNYHIGIDSETKDYDDASIETVTEGKVYLGFYADF